MPRSRTNNNSQVKDLQYQVESLKDEIKVYRQIIREFNQMIVYYEKSLGLDRPVSNKNMD